MRISAIRNHANFRGELFADIGASRPDASCKLKECDNTGKEMNIQKTLVNKERTGYFKDEKGFVNSIADRICEFYGNLDKKGLSKIVVFLPGATYNTECIKTPNLKTKAGDSLENIDFGDLPSILTQKGIKINKKADTLILQDSMGIGLSILQDMAKKEELQKEYLYPGASYTAIMTGGGCGISQIDVLNKNKILIKGAGSNYLSDAEQSVRVSDIGASVKATLGVFGKWMGFSEKDTRDIINAGVGEIITNKTVSLEKTLETEKLKDILLKSGKYTLKETPKAFTLTVNKEAMPQFNKARIETLNKYASAIARFLPVKLAEGSNGLILTGPFAFSLDNCLKKDYKTTLPNLIKEKFVPYNSGEYQSMIDKYNFKIICDKELFPVSNNTDCSLALNYAKPLANRRNWLIIDSKKLIKASLK